MPPQLTTGWSWQYTSATILVVPQRHLLPGNKKGYAWACVMVWCTVKRPWRELVQGISGCGLLTAGLQLVEQCCLMAGRKWQWGVVSPWLWVGEVCSRWVFMASGAGACRLRPAITYASSPGEHTCFEAWACCCIWCCHQVSGTVTYSPSHFSGLTAWAKPSTCPHALLLLTWHKAGSQYLPACCEASCAT